MWHVWERGDVHSRFLWGKQMEKKNYLENLAADGRVLMHLQEVVWGSMDWINLAQDRDSWRALVKAVMNLRVP